MKAKEYLLVYGTLLRGLHSSKTRFLNDHAQFMGEVLLPGRLYDLGEYPGLVHDPEAVTTVLCHLFDLNDPGVIFSVLDPYEGIDPTRPERGPYTRRRVEVEWQHQKRSCWTYLFTWDTKPYPLISSGNYLTYVVSNPRHQQFIQSA